MSRDEEGLVDAGVDRGGRLARVGRDRGGRGGVARGALLGRVGAGGGWVFCGQSRRPGDQRLVDGLRDENPAQRRRPGEQGGDSHVDRVLVGLARDEVLPRVVALGNDFGRVLFVLGLAREGEGVFGLAVGDLVDAEPLVGGADEAGHVALDVLDVVELGGEGVVDVDDDDLPVGLALVEEGHDAEDLDLLDLTGVADRLSDLADVEGVVVAVCLGLGVLVGGVLPGLGEGAVVPDVALVREAVADVAELALLGVLEDGVELLLLGDLELAVGPAGDLDDHVEDGAVLVGKEGHVVERRDDLAVLLEEGAVLERVERADLACKCRSCQSGVLTVRGARGLTRG